MSLLILGISHHTSDLDLLERVAVPSDERRKVVRELTGLDHVMEAVLVSTCNRVEAYVHLARFHEGLDQVAGYLGQRAGDRVEDFLEAHHIAWDEDVADHLFRVVGGLESMVVGERQIAMQVRDAMELARAEGTARHMLQRLFRQAVRVGRRLRHETNVSEGASSMVDVAMADAAVVTDADTAALIVGAGTIGSLAAEHLARVSDLHVWNRSPDKAQRLAGHHDAIVESDLAAAVATAELVVCTTGAPEHLVTTQMVAARDGRPVTILDLAVPRNVDPAVAELPGVRLVGLEEVRRAADTTLRDDVMAAAEALVHEEVEDFRAWLSAREVTPVIRALRGRAEEVRRDEIERFANRLSDLDDSQRNTIEALTEGIVNTLLHRPTIRLKERADDGGAQVAADVVRDLFDLVVEDDEVSTDQAPVDRLSDDHSSDDHPPGDASDPR